jgi:hypothetical protein
MDMIFPDEGLIFTLQRVAGNGPSSTTGNYWGLYTNNITPGRSSVKATFTIDTTNFSLVQKKQDDLTLQTVVADIASIQGASLTFTNGGGSSVNVYGYVILDPSQTFVVAAVRLDSAPVAVAAGATLAVVPIYQSRSQLP